MACTWRPRPQVSLRKTFHMVEEWCLTWSVLEMERWTRHCIIKYPANHIMHHAHYRKYTWNILGKNNFNIFVSKILTCSMEAEFPVTFLYISFHFPLGSSSLISWDKELPLELCLYCFSWGFTTDTVSLSGSRHHCCYNCPFAFIPVTTRVSNAAFYRQLPGITQRFYINCISPTILSFSYRW